MTQICKCKITMVKKITNHTTALCHNCFRETANKPVLQKIIFVSRDISPCFLWFFMSPWMNEHRHTILLLKPILSQHNPFIPSHHVSVRCIYHLNILTSSRSQSFRFPNKIYYAFTSCPIRATCPVHLIHDHRNNI